MFAGCLSGLTRKSAEMGCLLLIATPLLMYLGILLFYAGSLFGPLFFWSSAAITGVLGAAFLKHPPTMPPPDEDVPGPKAN